MWEILKLRRHLREQSSYWFSWLRKALGPMCEGQTFWSLASICFPCSTVLISSLIQNFSQPPFHWSLCLFLFLIHSTSPKTASYILNQFCWWQGVTVFLSKSQKCEVNSRLVNGPAEWTNCQGLNAYVPVKSHVEILTLKVLGIRRWELWGS